MNNKQQTEINQERLTLGLLPLPAKALVTLVLLTLSLGMAGAAGQIIVHDIIPTFFSDGDGHTGHDHQGKRTEMPHHSEAVTDNHAHQANDESFFDGMEDGGKVDSHAEIVLFAQAPIVKETVNETTAFYNSEQFVWLLKWTHIHLFGINFIFILLGTVTYLLNLTEKLRTWLIVLPFLGILIDIAALWLKSYISPAFFWLHIPGGGLFGSIFAFVFFRGFWEMWIGSIKVDSP
jgi:hypothetical protein